MYSEWRVPYVKRIQLILCRTVIVFKSGISRTKNTIKNINLIPIPAYILQAVETMQVYEIVFIMRPNAMHYKIIIRKDQIEFTYV